MLNNATDVHQAVAIQKELQVAKMPLPTQVTIDVTTWPGRCRDFLVIFFFAINLKCFKNKIGKFKEITVSKLTCLNICDISICHTFCCLFATPSFCCKRLPFLPFLRVQETTDRWSSLPGATRMGHLKVHGTGTRGIRFRLDVPVGKIAMTNPLEVQPATIFLGKLV